MSLCLSIKERVIVLVICNNLALSTFFTGFFPFGLQVGGSHPMMKKSVLPALKVQYCNIIVP